MKSPRLHLNLLREAERVSSSPIRFRVMLPVLALLACVGGVIWWTMLATQLLVMKAQVTALQGELSDNEKRHESILRQQSEARDKQATLDQLEMYSAARSVYGGALARLAEVVPQDVQLTRIEIPEPPPQNLLPPNGKGAPAWGPTDTVERVTLRLMGRTTKDTPVVAFMNALEGADFADTLVIAKDAPEQDVSPRVRSFRQDGAAGADGSRLLVFDVEYRCMPRRFEKSAQPAAAPRGEVAK